MASVNKVILVGNLGRDPEVRSNPDGFSVANVSLATTFAWNDRNTGERREETEWHRVVFYNRQAEVVSQYLKKGSSVYVEGRLRTRKYMGRDGIERYTTEIVAENMQMLGGRNSMGDAPMPDEYGAAPAYGSTRSGSPMPQPGGMASSAYTAAASDGFSTNATPPRASGGDFASTGQAPSVPRSNQASRPAAPATHNDAGVADLDENIPF